MQYEVEIKSLLGSQGATDKLIADLKASPQGLVKIGQKRQYNHYFISGKLEALASAVAPLLDAAQQKVLAEIVAQAVTWSVRSRQSNDDVLLIVKAGLDEGSAVHGHKRLEFEAPVAMTIDELDELILSAGFEREAKWFAERTLYRHGDVTLDVIFSPGYGYMVEFEKVVTNEQEAEQARQSIIALMNSLGLEEFNPDLLERMYAYYNAHWQEYYGTRKIFTLPAIA